LFLDTKEGGGKKFRIEPQKKKKKKVGGERAPARTGFNGKREKKRKAKKPGTFQ